MNSQNQTDPQNEGSSPAPLLDNNPCCTVCGKRITRWGWYEIDGGVVCEECGDPAVVTGHSVNPNGVFQRTPPTTPGESQV